MADSTVHFDRNCELCTLLANLMQRGVSTDEMAFIPSDGASELLVVTGEQTYVGQDAWTWILKHHPNLSSLQWLAAKLGLTQNVSHVMARGAHMLKSLCRNCGGSLLRKIHRP